MNINNFPMPNLNSSTTYYWRIKQVGSATTGYMPGGSFTTPPPTVPPGSLTFGTTTIGTIRGTFGSNQWGNKNQLPGNGQISNITAYLEWDGSGSNNVKAVIYNDNSGFPGSKRAESTARTFTTTPSWVTFTFSPAVSLTAGTYWLSILGQEPGIYGYYDSGAANINFFKDSAPYPTAMDPASGFSLSSHNNSIYAVYTATAAPFTLDSFTGSSSCFSSSYTATLSWSGTAMPANESCPNGYWVDISTDDFASFYNKCVQNATTTTAPDGFSSNLIFQPNTKYYARVFHGFNNPPAPWTNTLTLDVPNSCAPPPSPTPTSTPIPTPTPTPTSTPTPTITPTPIPIPVYCGSGTARATGLVSTADLFPGSNFGSSGACIVDPKAAFAPFRIPTFEDLKSLYYDQK